VGGFGVFHGVLFELVGLLDEKAEDYEDGGKDGADAQAGAPDDAEVLVVAGYGDDVGYEGADDEPLFVC
jgi:hypothetical protein